MLSRYFFPFFFIIISVVDTKLFWYLVYFIFSWLRAIIWNIWTMKCENKHKRESRDFPFIIIALLIWFFFFRSDKKIIFFGRKKPYLCSTTLLCLHKCSPNMLTNGEILNSLGQMNEKKKQFKISIKRCRWRIL